MMEGYLADDGTVSTVDRGWQRTGDLGHLDPGGNLHVVGASWPCTGWATPSTQR